jgi:hypothetical protein
LDECADDECVATGFILRVTLAMVLLSSMTGVMVIGVRSGSDTRAMFQNNFFAVKWLVLGGIIVANIWMDNQSIVNYGEPGMKVMIV